VQTRTDPVVETLAEEWGAIGAIGSALDAEEWELPSECPGWTVRDVISHLVGTERSLLGEQPPKLAVDTPSHVRNPVGVFNESWIQARRVVAGLEVLAEFVEVTERRLAQMRTWPVSRFEEVGPSPVGEVPYRQFMELRVMDCWVHEQDIRLATERPGHRQGPAAELAIDRIASAMGFVVGKQAQAPEGVFVRFDVVGDVPRRLDIEVRQGRAVAVEDLEAEPTAVLRMDQESFWRLACGRVPGDAALFAGLVELEGDISLARQVLSSMAFMI
jgi:uncharacterized protein (TIGR03083 family)